MNHEQIMKQCQIGTRNHDAANNLHAECYGAIGQLLHQQSRLIRHIETLISCANSARDWDEIKEARNFIRGIK